MGTRKFCYYPTSNTLQGTNISPKNGILKMIFLFPRWDMLIPWRVSLQPKKCWFQCYNPRHFSLWASTHYHEWPQQRPWSRQVTLLIGREWRDEQGWCFQWLLASLSHWFTLVFYSFVPWPCILLLFVWHSFEIREFYILVFPPVHLMYDIVLLKLSFWYHHSLFWHGSVDIGVLQ